MRIRLPHDNDKGLTLVELMISVVIMAITIPTFYSILAFIARGVNHSTMRESDARAIQSVIDYYKRTGTTLSVPQTGYNATLNVTNSDVAGVKQIVVTMTRSGRTFTYTFLWAG